MNKKKYCDTYCTMSGTRRLMVVASFALTLTACGEVTPYQAPETVLPDRYSLLQPVQSSRRHNDDWWRDFSDASLDRLVAEASLRNVALAQERARVIQAEARAASAGAVIEASASASASASSAGAETIGVGVQIGFDPFGIKRAARSNALALLEAARLGERDRRRVVLSQLATAFIELRYLQQVRTYRQQDLRSFQRLTVDIERQLEGAGATRLDLARARALRAESRVEIAKSEALIAAQRNRISTLLGTPAGPGGISLGTGGQPVPKGRVSAGVPADLLRNRPDIRQAERLYAAAVSNIDAARASRFPRLTLGGLVVSPLGQGGTVSSVTGGLVIPILSNFQFQAKVDLAEAQAVEALLNWRALVLGAVEEVETALTALRSAQQAIDAARQAVSYYTQALRLSKQIVSEGGRITLLDVLQQEESLVEARKTLALSIRDMGLNYVVLHSALGTDRALPTVTAPLAVAAATAPAVQ